MKKILLVIMAFIFYLSLNIDDSTIKALTEKPGGQWHFMWTDQWGHDNYQCQPVQQNPECWPVWAWKVIG
jgi:hypothetical protein